MQKRGQKRKVAKKIVEGFYSKAVTKPGQIPLKFCDNETKPLMESLRAETALHMAEPNDTNYGHGPI